jgi:hypothetical protein
MPDIETYETPEHGWVCFHCGDHFPSDLAGQRAARDHFGAMSDAEPACRIKNGEERRLVQALRRQEAANDHLRSVLHNEDSETDRAMTKMKHDHAAALRRAEEEGYARGLRDARLEGIAASEEGA